MANAENGPEDLNAHPHEWVAQACAELGTAVVLDWCTDLLAGADPTTSEHALTWIGGQHAAELLEQGERTGPRQEHHLYWPQVWAARAMRYAWADGSDAAHRAGGALVAALGDEHWRVREMAAKVVGLHEIAAGADALAALRRDPKARVRAAAAAALGVVAGHEHLAALAGMTEDRDRTVRSTAKRALDASTERLDLPRLD